jgi:hypothetical protein
MRTTLCFYKEIIQDNTSFRVSLNKSDERISNTKFNLGISYKNENIYEEKKSSPCLNE